MGIEIEVKAPLSLDRGAAIFNPAIAVTGDVETGAERVIAGVCGQSAVMREPEPGEKEVPRTMKKSGVGLSRSRAGGSQAAIFFTFILAACDIAVPEIKFKKHPAPAFPSATLAAAAVTSSLSLERPAPAAAAVKSSYEKNSAEQERAVSQHYL